MMVYSRYAAFAVVASAANLAAQALFLQFYSARYALAGALVLGTGTGLITKYVLDKHWIFADRSTGLAAHGRAFTLYSLTGLATTAIFWGTEYGFDRLTPDGHLRYVGGAIGLAIGYCAKFQLDRRFVFRTQIPGVSADRVDLATASPEK
jgi:putative flippase GtrA